MTIISIVILVVLVLLLALVLIAPQVVSQRALNIVFIVLFALILFKDKIF